MFLMVLIPAFLYFWSQETVLSVEQRQARRKMLVCITLCATVFFTLLLIIMLHPMGQAEKMFLITISPIPFATALLCCHRWIYCHSYKGLDHNVKRGITFSVVLIGASFICIILLAFMGYNAQVNEHSNLPERLPPAVPPPVDLSPQVADPAKNTVMVD